MGNSNLARTSLLVGILAVAGLAGSASAETTQCTEITSVPATITTQGVYCLKSHSTSALSSGAAITIMVNNVTIDCNDYKLGNLLSGPGTTASGILAENRLNITIRNCGIRGFQNGVLLTNGDYRVEDNRLDLNTQTAINVSGDGSAVRRNEVIDTGGSAIGGLVNFHGITISGDVDVIDNNITGVLASAGSNGSVYGIRTTDMDSGTIRGNRVRNLVADGSGARRGIWNQNGNHNTVEGNTVIMDGSLLIGEAAIRCGDGIILNGASRDNTVLGTGVLQTALGLVNCTSVAGDYVNPL